MRRAPILDKKINIKNRHSNKRHNNYRILPNTLKKSLFSSLENEKTRNLALGTVVLGAIGMTAFLWLTKKNKRRDWKNKLYEVYQDTADFTEDAYEGVKQASDYASDRAHQMYHTIEHSRPVSLLLLGALGGTVLGGSLIYLLNRKIEQSHFVEKVSNTVDSLKNNLKSNDWVRTAKDFLDSFEDQAESPSKSFINSQAIQDAIDLGMTGYRLWESLSKKRK